MVRKYEKSSAQERKNLPLAGVLPLRVRLNARTRVCSSPGYVGGPNALFYRVFGISVGFVPRAILFTCFFICFFI